MPTSLRRVALALSLTAWIPAASAQDRAPAPTPATAPAEALAAWRAQRFGMFVHWGPVSLTGREIGWSRGAPTPIEEYDQLYRRFDPTRFDAEEWVAVAKAAGARYLVLTTKHHDGFCLWPSEHTEYDIAETPFGRDVVGELAAACRAGGVAFGTYYSVPDWYHPDYPKGSPAGSSDKPDPDPERYARYLRAQVTELVTRYGPLFTLWFDMPREFGPEHGVPTVEMLRGLQPDIVINDRAYIGAGREQVGDYSTPEQRVGGFDRERPWESCITICRQWSWKPDDQLKSLEECVWTLLSTIGGDGNLLLNVGPMPDGRIEPRQVERLRELGAWVERHAEAIYGTRGGPFRPGPWGAATCAGERVFLFLRPWSGEGPLRLPPIGAQVTGARFLEGGGALVEQSDEGLALHVPPERRDPLATVIELSVEGQAFAIPPVDVPPPPSGSLAFGRPATASNTFRGMAQYGPDKAFDDDPRTRWATDSGTGSAWIEVDLGAPTRIGSILVDEPAEYARVRAFELQAEQGGEWRTVHAGTTIGPGWTTRFEDLTARRVRLAVREATEGPTIWEIRLFPPRE